MHSNKVLFQRKIQIICREKQAFLVRIVIKMLKIVMKIKKKYACKMNFNKNNSKENLLKDFMKILIIDLKIYKAKNKSKKKKMFILFYQ